MVREIRVGPRHVALVDDGDFEAMNQFKWYPSAGRNTTYARATIDGRTIALHVLILNPPAGLLADHINGNGLDCRRENLRPATHSQSLANRTRPCNNRSGFKGVSRRRESGSWSASICIEGKTIRRGGFATAEDAAHEYDELAREHFGEFARLNFPSPEEHAA